jgi:hypothetical protein
VQKLLQGKIFSSEENIISLAEIRKTQGGNVEHSDQTVSTSVQIMKDG